MPAVIHECATKNKLVYFHSNFSLYKNLSCVLAVGADLQSVPLFSKYYCFVSNNKWKLLSLIYVHQIQSKR